MGFVLYFNSMPQGGRPCDSNRDNRLIFLLPYPRRLLTTSVMDEEYVQRLVGTASVNNVVLDLERGRCVLPG